MKKLIERNPRILVIYKNGKAKLYPRLTQANSEEGAFRIVNPSRELIEKYSKGRWKLEKGQPYRSHDHWYNWIALLLALGAITLFVVKWYQ
jgi:hypothetical protein